jgi:type II secretory pathway component PulM
MPTVYGKRSHCRVPKGASEVKTTTTKRGNPSLPHILTTGAVLIALQLHLAWEQSTPRERGALAVMAMGEAQSFVAVVGWVGMPVPRVGGQGEH